MSVRWMRSLKIRDSKVMEAISWGKEVCGYCEKKVPGIKIHQWLDAFGELNTMRWTLDATDLGHIEKIQSTLMMDQGYWQLVQKAIKDGLFIDGSGVDNIYREV